MTKIFQWHCVTFGTSLIISILLSSFEYYPLHWSQASVNAFSFEISSGRSSKVACSRRISVVTPNTSSSVSVWTRRVRYSLTPGNPWRYWTRCFRISSAPFGHFVSMSSRAWSSITSRISRNIGRLPLERKHHGLPKEARPIINPSRFFMSPPCPRSDSSPGKMDSLRCVGWRIFRIPSA